ncbi:uncharacterized protein A1O9_12909 [Exophiala aquamarina CBS 119918]|uniref:Uncharacterized protein n=1 Tax=Exophiala aquamarina CBS 119918 TaxID=1182545 RepID=A0A072P5Y1_9EURO|nr:uncharacterized protein A1O9_12909 [Exophiala aquamarina CBS 119918]KEF51025.1 hypothetical protein A1O9_12909 [Exophiala aquamarina CBS 119918]
MSQVQAATASHQDFNLGKDEDHDLDDDDLPRSILGSLVSFDDMGHVFKASLPTDFSLACIIGLAHGTTPEAVVDIFRGLSFRTNTDCH